MDGSKCRASLVRLWEGIEEKGPLVSRLAARACRSSAEDSAEARRLVTGIIITIIIMFAPVRGVAVAGEAEIMALLGVREVKAKRVLLTLLFGGGSNSNSRHVPVHGGRGIMSDYLLGAVVFHMLCHSI
ncbi:hypothetical protein HDV62DRAFT_37536 [Trichoderma sp. SZMC 28011]